MKCCAALPCSVCVAAVPGHHFQTVLALPIVAWQQLAHLECSFQQTWLTAIWRAAALTMDDFSGIAASSACVTIRLTVKMTFQRMSGGAWLEHFSVNRFLPFLSLMSRQLR